MSIVYRCYFNHSRHCHQQLFHSPHLQSNVVISHSVFRSHEFSSSSSTFYYRPNKMDQLNDRAKWLPPASVRGMLELNRDDFRKEIRLPQLEITGMNVNSILPPLKHLLFKMEHLKPMQTFGDDNKRRRILLHPAAVSEWNDLPAGVRQLVAESQFTWTTFPLTYDNWKADEILRAILPADQEAVTSFSRIGHIVHLNLRDQLLPYKQLIGAVMLDKVANCRTVVNKCQSIDSTFRNFQLELLAGTADYLVEVKENGITFQFDFSTVYWNPRLATEHERIVKMLNGGDVLYDIFAGVGPFSVPAARKRCAAVLANDLNPNSFKWLQANVRRNKVGHVVRTFNEDGRAFIVGIMKADLLERWNAPPAAEGEYKIHITMNLPAMAVEFLDSFRGLISRAEFAAAARPRFPLVHVYCFAKGVKRTT